MVFAFSYTAYIALEIKITWAHNHFFFLAVSGVCVNVCACVCVCTRALACVRWGDRQGSGLKKQENTRSY